jgi:hypothetical protein
MIRLAASTLLVGTVFAVGVAQAEPLTLTEDQMDQVTAAGFGAVNFQWALTKNKNANTTINFTKTAVVRSNVSVQGYLADAEAGADCFGFGCVAETLTGTETDAFGIVAEPGSRFFGWPSATSVSESVSASNFFVFDPPRPCPTC